MAALFTALPATGQERREVPEFRTYGEPKSPEIAAAIDDLIRDFKDAWSRQDTDALIELHADDVELINAYARIFQGAEPLAHFLEHRLFPNFSPEVSRQEVANMKMISIRYLPGAAVVHMYTDGERGSSRNEGEVMRRTHIHLVLVEQSDAWRIVHTAIMDAR
ncbi:MAG: YybH family protein [Longimicrobiales bacterium]